jgi:hypothetical protein
VSQKYRIYSYDWRVLGEVYCKERQANDLKCNETAANVSEFHYEMVVIYSMLRAGGWKKMHNEVYNLRLSLNIVEVQ